MAIHSFEIVSVPVRDPQRAKAFYRDVLGFDLVRESPMGPDMTWKKQPGGLQGVMVNCDDIDAEHARLRASGLDIGPIGSEPWGRYALFQDPDGNGWVLRQPPAAAPA